MTRFAFLAAIPLFGCSGSTTTTTTPNANLDASLEGGNVVDSRADSRAEAAEGDGGCQYPDLDTLQVPSVALNDAGATTLGCSVCIKENCSQAYRSCNDLCDCRDRLASLYECAAEGESILACGISVFNAPDPALQRIGQALAACALTACPVECAAPSFLFDGGLPVRDASSDTASAFDAGSAPDVGSD